MDSDPLPSGIDQYLLLGVINSPALLISLLILLLICSALISASEVAYFSLSPKDNENLSNEDFPSSRRILNLKASPRQLLATILISNNFVNIAIVIISESLMKTLAGPQTFENWAAGLQSYLHLNWFSLATLATIISFTITIVAVTFLLVLFGEVAPKIYANLNNVRHARFMSAPLQFLSKLFYPFSSILLNWSGGIEERVYRKRLLSNSSTDKKELDKAIELTVTNHEDREEVDILKGIIKFGDVETKQIMKSRVDVVGLEIQQGFKDVIQIIKQSGYSRLPVYEEDFDTVVGILYVKDLLGLTQEENDFNWQNLVRSNVLYIPETKKIDELLKEFQSKRTHMAIVVDEYGGSSGIVTLEDIMEEVVGDIRDEFDSQEEVDYVKIDDHNYIFEGKTLLNDVVRVLNLDGDTFDEGRGNADSLAGLILELEGVIPKRDNELHYKGLKLIPTQVSKRRIEKVQVCL